MSAEPIPQPEPVHAATEHFLRAESDRIGFGVEDFRAAGRNWFATLAKELDDYGDEFHAKGDPFCEVLWRIANSVVAVGKDIPEHLDAVNCVCHGGAP